MSWQLNMILWLISDKVLHTSPINWVLNMSSD